MFFYGMRIGESAMRSSESECENLSMKSINLNTCFFFFYKHIKFSDEARLCLSYHKIKDVITRMASLKAYISLF